MKFRFKDIGPIRKLSWSLAISRSLPVANNTGKTYMVYTLYGFLKSFTDLLFGKAGSVFLRVISKKWLPCLPTSWLAN